ncbi:MAG: hypothetical protein LUH18_04385 [Oscillospiraceae bacterium]|nr:hypothetical protein [Oscillospiraceae bacterium]
MEKFLKLIFAGCLAMILFCSCGSEANVDSNDSDADNANVAEKVTLSEEDEELLDTFGEDLIVTGADDFVTTVSSFTSESVGQVYQLTGYYQTTVSEDETTDYLGDATSGSATQLIELRYLSTDLTVDEQYTVTGIVALESHGDHYHIVFDVVTVESYVG